MRQVTMHEAKTHLSRLVDEAAAGEPSVLCKAGRRLSLLAGHQKLAASPGPVRLMGGMG